jgi:hypothetical protein
MTSPKCERCGEEYQPAQMPVMSRIRLALMMLFAIHETCGCTSQRFSYGTISTGTPNCESEVKDGQN